MNKYIIAGIGFVAGAAVGGAGAWFVTKKKLENDFEERLDTEIEKTRKLYSSNLYGASLMCNGDCANCDDCKVDEDAPVGTACRDGVVTGPGDDITETAENTGEVIEEKDIRYLSGYTAKANAVKDRLADEHGGRVKYSNIGKSITDAGVTYKGVTACPANDIVVTPPIKREKPYEETREEVDPVELAINNDQPAKSIHIITPEQYGTERTGFEKESLVWWKKNKLLTTEDYEILDVPDLIGTEWRGRFGEFEPNMVYVRNEDQETDYEIRLETEDYYDYI